MARGGRRAQPRHLMHGRTDLNDLEMLLGFLAELVILVFLVVSFALAAG